MTAWDDSLMQLATVASTVMGERGIVGRHWSSVRVPLDDLAVDRSALIGVSIELDRTASGELWLDDLRFE